MSFLHSVAYQIFEDHKNNLHDITVVLPSQRSCIFFLKYLAECSRSVTIAPEVLTMEQFMVRIAGQEPTEPSKLLIALFEVARTHVPERCASLSEFLSWGTMVLNDFNMVDEHLIDPKNILTNTARAKILEMWQLNASKEKGELEKKFEAFYETLPILYDSYISLLHEKKFNTRGLVYKEASQRILNTSLPGKKVYFAGFNALTESEYTVIAHLVKAGRGEFIGDYDVYYTSFLPNHEAGTFFRKWKEKGFLSQKSTISNDLLTREKKITHHQVSGRAHQTHILAELIGQLGDRGLKDYKRVAVILPDESMLFPVLHHLPVVPEGINLTMQMPLGKLPVFQWVVSFIRALEYASRPDSKGTYYHQLLLDVLTNALAFSFFNAEKIYDLQREITRNNLIFIKYTLINEYLCDNGHPLFNPVSSAAEVVDSARKLIDIGASKSHHNDLLEKEQIFMLREVLNELHQIVEDWPDGFLKMQDIVPLMDSLAMTYGITLKGEPVQGLQIMGMLETRLLDFDTVFILSANEDILPKSPVHESIIPYDIAVSHGLPEHRLQQAVYSYHFYQLIRNSKEIHLLSYTPAFGTEQSMPSRYLYQVVWELAAENKNIHFSTLHHTLSPKSINVSADFTIKKDEQFVRDVSEKLLIKGISPTHLANYIERPKNFYTRYVLAIQDEEEIIELADARIKGNAVHNTLKRIYEPFKTKPISDKESLRKLENQIDHILEDELKKVLPNADWSTGRNYLDKILTRQMILNQIRLDISRIDAKPNCLKNRILSHLEENFETVINIPNLGQVKLYGFIDRIEKIGNYYHIIDYKTGTAPSVKHFDLSGMDFFDRKKRKNYGKPLQLLCYMLMVSDMLGKNGCSLSASLHFLKHKSDNEKYLFKNKSGQSYSFEDSTLYTFRNEDLDPFRGVIIELIQEMLDLERPENQFLSESYYQFD